MAYENLAPKVIRELVKELRTLSEAPPEGIRMIVSEDNLANIQAEIDGPVGTPYEGGLFRMKLVLGQEFPQAPPKGFFVTRVFHPNIAKNGEICVNTLKKDWRPTLGLRHVLVVVRCLLIEPFPESALNEEAGKMLMEDYEGYARHARLMTSIHALRPSRSKPTSKSSSDVCCISVASSLEGSFASHTPLTMNMANTDPLGAETATVTDNTTETATENTPLDCISLNSSSPTAKKSKGDSGLKPTADKRKVDIRKRSLKRL